MFKTIGKILGILLSVSIVVAAICIIIQCLSIYNSGDKPYSREAVSLAFSEISVFVYIFLGLLIINLVYNIFVENVYANKHLVWNSDFIIKSISKRKDVDKISNESIEKERRTRRIYTVLLYVMLTAGFMCFLIYALNPANYHQNEINATMIRMTIAFGIFIVLPFVYSIIYTFLINKSKEREIDLLIELAKDAPPKSEVHNITPRRACTFIKILAVTICVCIILYGLFTGGTADVLTKAINICTECIGLG